MSYKKELILVRGASGAGKSTFVDTMMFLHQNYDNTIVEEVSADNYFIDDDDIYRFNPKELPNAHKFCQDCVKNMMSSIADYEDNLPLNSVPYVNHFIFVHNTFTQEWEMKEYERLASYYGYYVRHIIVENRHESKSIHDVPDVAVKAQKERFEVKL